MTRGTGTSTRGRSYISTKLNLMNADRTFMPVDQEAKKWVTILAWKLTLIVILSNYRDKDTYFWSSGESQRWGKVLPCLVVPVNGNFQQPWSTSIYQYVCITPQGKPTKGEENLEPVVKKANNEYQLYYPVKGNKTVSPSFLQFYKFIYSLK